MEVDEDPTLEMFGALATCLAICIDLATPSQLSKMEAEFLAFLHSVNPESPAANVFRSALRQITERTGFFSQQ
ncbi:hypothetical protein QLQ15_13170 [Lysobacter sp. LF1]|uniref:Uncharacterized protein n=1 Tax=Lysobacter stagni TaxID=3045172 RepID=A0ABT6XI71_9GAMM|nr:hypothetical protein [Lysobacter sp. LF1]MDI9239856.1 hypothetical protein [Lysobacter sp. LF1]